LEGGRLGGLWRYHVAPGQPGKRELSTQGIVRGGNVLNELEEAQHSLFGRNLRKVFSAQWGQSLKKRGNLIEGETSGEGRGKARTLFGREGSLTHSRPGGGAAKPECLSGGYEKTKGRGL